MKEQSMVQNLIKNPTGKQKARFIIPSVIGAFFFLFPVWVDGGLNIPLGVISDWLAALIEPYAVLLTLMIVTISAVMSIICTFIKGFRNNDTLEKLFHVSPTYAIIRVIGAVWAFMIYYKAGPEWLWSSNTGGLMLDLMCTLIAWFFAASYLMPLLMEYGIMDYVGTLLRRVVESIFRLPGRAAIDLVASWIGNCNVGVILTTSQYESGYYTARESILIATCFSAVSLPFAMVTAAILNVQDYFFVFYLIAAIIGILSAMIMARIWPLGTKYKDEYYVETGKRVNEEIPEGVKKTTWAFRQAVTKAQEGPSVGRLLKDGTVTFGEIVFSLVPVSMFIGVVALALAEYTPFFDIISYPFGYYLNLLGVEEAFQVAPGTLAGFADMLIPALMCAQLTSVKTRFIIGVLSIVQIIYMAGTGIIILTSKMPVKLSDLVIIFLEKTIICIPMIVVLTNLAWYIFGF